mmetsp:Transcript_21440/g.48399  ORF Transcript_21440/g.48399 Transcript_21440/m.48399 type:complete len:204 (+) Transcript_21440:369-980(+)
MNFSIHDTKSSSLITGRSVKFPRAANFSLSVGATTSAAWAASRAALMVPLVSRANPLISRPSRPMGSPRATFNSAAVGALDLSPFPSPLRAPCRCCCCCWSRRRWGAVRLSSSCASRSSRASARCLKWFASWASLVAEALWWRSAWVSWSRRASFSWLARLSRAICWASCCFSAWCTSSSTSTRRCTSARARFSASMASACPK